MAKRPDATNQRKVEHIAIINEDRETDRRKFYFDEVRLRHRALPEINFDEVDTSIEFLGKRLTAPILISSMTGGDHATLRTINRNLAAAAERCQVALGVGSQRVMFTNPKSRSSFALRAIAPTTCLLANLGAVQLNEGFGLEHCREAVAALGADALYLHLNPLQEAVQPEGDTQFRGLAKKIGEIARHLGKPVILKEVGAGLSREDVQLVASRGVRYIDVAGSGGTSWSRIEHHRQDKRSANDLGILFQDWGIPTPRALWELREFRPRITLIASGGLRSGLDMAKALVLGASLCGMAAPFLAAAQQSTAAVVQQIERLQRELRTAMFLLGIRRIADLIGNTSLLMDPPGAEKRL
ncbi:MAG: type 2 isopentenyl-diphosphate Delta-isomerase [Kiritimatiellae bacterium]|nr:type 2 isopentenyl-diphosphate Delta-isomerase [Kiritimatiellia bacterium]MCO5067250.1 type 2 isopentenyl-diphosphate Delta-isomerase [Kiritimatiellia bacterium]